MTQIGDVQVPRWYWIVAALALLFEPMGCYAYLTQITMSEAELAALPPAQAELFRAMPVWISSAYAVAVWVGVGLSLLFRPESAPLSEQDGWKLLGILLGSTIIVPLALLDDRRRLSPMPQLARLTGSPP